MADIGYESNEPPLVCVPDKPIKSKARSTLPSLLAIGKCADGKPCILSKCTIQSRTQFGPLDAPLAIVDQAKKSKFLMKFKPLNDSTVADKSAAQELYYNTADENVCNWMSLVNPATVLEEQSLTSISRDGKVFFVTTKKIEPRQELKVWYSADYARFNNKAILPAQRQPSNDSRSRRQRKLKSVKFHAYFDIEEEGNGPEVRSVPPKKRGWRRANIKLVNEQAASSQQAAATDVSTIAKPNNAKSSNSKALPSQSDLTRDARGTTSPATAHTCPTCGRSFKRRYSLKIHCVVHSEVSSFLCQACGKRFKRKDKLKEHLKRMHSGKRSETVVEKPIIKNITTTNREELAYKCRHCSAAFRRRGMLVNHLLKKHPGVTFDSIPELSAPLTKRALSFVCPYCSKCYASVTKRTHHVKKHHPGMALPPGLRGLAKKGVVGSAELPPTIRAVGEIETQPVECPFCACQYSTWNKMAHHVTVKHPGRKPPKPVKNAVGENIAPSNELQTADLPRNSAPEVQRFPGTDLMAGTTLPDMSHCVEMQRTLFDIPSTSALAPSIDQIAGNSALACFNDPNHHYVAQQGATVTRQVANMSQCMVNYNHGESAVQQIRQPVVLEEYGVPGHADITAQQLPPPQPQQHHTQPQQLSQPQHQPQQHSHQQQLTHLHPRDRNKAYFRPRKHHLLQASVDFDRSKSSTSCLQPSYDNGSQVELTLPSQPQYCQPPSTAHTDDVQSAFQHPAAQASAGHMDDPQTTLHLTWQWQL